MRAILDSGLGLPMVALLGALLVAQHRRVSRQRSALNQALHELRRPLQAMALSVGAGPPTDVDGPTAGLSPGNLSVFSGSVWQAIRALGDLDRKLNGIPGRPRSRELLACRLMVDACVRRWQARARLAGSEIELRWAGPDALIRGDGTAISGAVENLILNAIEHGGSSITVNGLAFGRWVRVEVIDSGKSEPGPENPKPPPRSGRHRHGHGLEVVRSVAEDHHGKLDLSLSDQGSKAVFVLPASSATPPRGAPVRVNW